MQFDLAALPSRDRYKLLAGLVVPRPIALVTTRSEDGRDNAAPFSFFNLFAEEPPIVVLGIGVAASGGAKDTTNNIRDTGEFVVNMVDEPTAEAMNLCAVDFPPEVSEIDVAELELLASERVQARRIASSPAHLECRRLITLQPGRERYLILGEVLWSMSGTASSTRSPCGSRRAMRRSAGCSATAMRAPTTGSSCRA
jgi:flavin reductase (DIM6/NTAB) family NADH-FMN oxidoreductase RutF